MEVTVVTPTYNRRAFLPALIQIYRQQTFPKEKMEWIILDDGRDKVEDVFEEAAKTIPNVRYIRVEEKMRIGAKRNRLNREARGAIIIAMDDDDYYPPDRVAHVVAQYKKFPKIQLAGSSEMHLYNTDTQKIYVTGPFGPRHATNGTMAWRKTYSDTHLYNEFVTHAEEESFLENYRHPMIQLDPRKTILVLCHSDNTVDKSVLQLRTLPDRLEDRVKEPALREFYYNLKHNKRD